MQAWVDTVQGTILAIGMTASALIILVEYGGLEGIMPPDCQNLDEVGGELTGCVAVTRPDLVQVPSVESQVYQDPILLACFPIVSADFLQ